MKKFFVLAFLFALPIVAYLFFASGVNNFGRLPILTEKISPLNNFRSLDGKPVKLQDKITILGFFGDQIPEMKGHAFNLNWVIYKDYHEFYDFQFVIVAQNDSQAQAKALLNEMGERTDMEKWNFVFGGKSEIKNFFKSLETDLELNNKLATPRVFIIDKNRALRGRDDDEEAGKILYGYNTASVAELKNKMVDDVKVILAEYRLKLKKYKGGTTAENK